MKLLLTILIPLALCGAAFGQATQPTTRPVGAKTYVGVWAQPPVDANGVKLLQKWYDAGCRTFVGWASIRNTAGANPLQDRAAQLEWRNAVRALGPDAKYIDYPQATWQQVPTDSELAAMVNDPQCAGFVGPDEPNLSPPTDATGKLWRVSLPQWQAYWAPIVAADPGNTKIRVGDFSGEKLSASWGFYTGADAVPYADPLTVTCADWHPRSKYGDTRADCDLYPGRSVRMLGKFAPNKPRWYIFECANEQITAIGRAPTEAELIAQYNGVMAEDSATAPIQGILFFPQRPRPNASHIFDNTTPEQFAAVKRIITAFTPASTVVQPEEIASVRATIQAQAARIAALEQNDGARAAQIDALTARANELQAARAVQDAKWIKVWTAATQPSQP